MMFGGSETECFGKINNKDTVPADATPKVVEVSDDTKIELSDTVDPDPKSQISVSEKEEHVPTIAQNSQTADSVSIPLSAYLSAISDLHEELQQGELELKKSQSLDAQTHSSEQKLLESQLSDSARINPESAIPDPARINPTQASDPARENDCKKVVKPKIVLKKKI
jgi:hypothetical protein